MLVKVNSVMIPTINDHHLEGTARKASGLGAFTQNIMPSIPLYKFAHGRPPNIEEKERVKNLGSRNIRQMRHFGQRRSDAIWMLGKDISREMHEPKDLPGMITDRYMMIAVTKLGREWLG